MSSLKESGNYHIIGTDIYRRDQIATVKDVDDFYIFPSAVENQESYIEYVLAFCKKHNVSFYFATIDEEIANISINRHRFIEIGIRVCIPNTSLIEICHYKDRFFDWIDKNIPRIAMKTYRDIDSTKNAQYPLFMKPIEGRASIGCRKIDNPMQLEQLLKDGVTFEHYVVQEFMDGDVVSVDMVRNADTGQKIQVQRVEEIRNSSGCGISVQIIDDEVLTDICDELMEKLDLNGIVNAEFFRNGSDYCIIEINPRLSAGTSFTILAGLNTPLNAIRIAKGKECEFGSIAYGKHFAKRYETYKLD